MKQKRLDKPSVYLVIFWSDDGLGQLRREVYPMHLFTLEQVTEKLKGREMECDIYESRYNIDLGEYITVGRTLIWTGAAWIVQL